MWKARDIWAFGVVVFMKLVIGKRSSMWRIG